MMVEIERIAQRREVTRSNLLHPFFGLLPSPGDDDDDDDHGDDDGDHHHTYGDHGLPA